MLAFAAALIWLTGLAHSILGERYILVRLLRRADSLPKVLGSTAFTAGTLRFAWHLTTVAWWAFALMLALASQNALSSTLVLQVIAGASVVSAALPLFFTRGKHLSWLVFLLVAALVLLAI